MATVTRTECDLETCKGIILDTHASIVLELRVARQEPVAGRETTVVNGERLQRGPEFTTHTGEFCSRTCAADFLARHVPDTGQAVQPAGGA